MRGPEAPLGTGIKAPSKVIEPRKTEVHHRPAFLRTGRGWFGKLLEEEETAAHRAPSLGQTLSACVICSVQSKLITCILPFFHGSIVDVQCYIGFRGITQWFDSYLTCVLPLS